MLMRPTGLGRLGIIITYLGIIATVSICLIAFFGGYVSEFLAYWIFGGSLAFTTILLLLTIRYDSGFSNNYILVGILGLLLTFLGGLFILIGVKEIDANFTVNSNETHKNNSYSLESITYSRPSGLGRLGIIITYLGIIVIVSISLMAFFGGYVSEITGVSIFGGLLTYSFILLLMTVRYDSGFSNNYKLVGIFAFLLSLGVVVVGFTGDQRWLPITMGIIQILGSLFILKGVKKIGIFSFNEIIDQVIQLRKMYEKALISQLTVKNLILKSEKKLEKLEKEFFENHKISLSEKLLLLEKLSILVAEGIIQKEELIRISNRYFI